MPVGAATFRCDHSLGYHTTHQRRAGQAIAAKAEQRFGEYRFHAETGRDIDAAVRCAKHQAKGSAGQMNAASSTKALHRAKLRRTARTRRPLPHSQPATGARARQPQPARIRHGVGEAATDQAGAGPAVRDPDPLHWSDGGGRSGSRDTDSTTTGSSVGDEQPAERMPSMSLGENCEGELRMVGRRGTRFPGAFRLRTRGRWRVRSRTFWGGGCRFRRLIFFAATACKFVNV